LSPWLIGLAWAAPVAAQEIWTVERPGAARRTGTFANRLLTESSGVAASRRWPGVLWTHNDAGHDALLFATDTTGADLATFRLTGARNVDWEDIALGPCHGVTCVYLADTGDNDRARASVAIYRVPEPVPHGNPDRLRATARAEVLAFRYPDGPHNVEALWVDPAGDAYLVTKQRRGRARLYRLPAEAWSSAGPVAAQALGSVPIEAQGRAAGGVTGAALSPGARWVAVRSYVAIYFFRRAASGALELPARPLACDVLGLEPQGEGVTWLDEHHLALTSERGRWRRGTVAVVECPLPDDTTAGRQRGTARNP
jgi:hypothetical protein